MKINIITRHAVANYGSVLQTYALQEVIKGLGYESEIINYIPEEEKTCNIAKTLLYKSKKFNSNSTKSKLYVTLQTLNFYIMDKKFKKIRNKYFIETKEIYHTLRELENKIPNGEIFCTGSDQVWGPIGTNKYDKAYFLDFVPKNKKCITYAASFGKTEFDKDYLSILKELMQKYNNILVREKSAVELLQKLNVENVNQVLDPTLLIQREKWDELSNYKVKDKKYILIYQLHKNKKMDEYAKKIAKSRGFTLIRISPSLHQLTRDGRFVYLPDIEKFLAYIKNAEYVITDSFHGTAFAINFNKEFISIYPDKTSTRNQSILELTQLTNRVLNNYEDFTIGNEKINYERVNKILAIEREKSLKFLYDSINSR